jgi:hypothetical protein
MAANVSKQQITLNTSDNFVTAAIAALSVPGGTTVFKGFLAVETNAPQPNAAGTVKSQVFTVVTLWADS